MKNLAVFLTLILCSIDVSAQTTKAGRDSKPPRGGDIGMVILSQPGVAATSGRAPWDWTLEERLAARCNREAARLRANSAASDQAMTVGTRISHADVISGRTHPELFLPAELFESVVRGAFLVEGWREVYGGDIAKAGLPGDFLTGLQEVSSRYVPLLREQQTIRIAYSRMAPTERAVASARLATLEVELCREGHAALIAARGQFGPALDRFLYGAVAASRTMYLDEISDAAVLRARERGCR